jgi:monofunctional biosynthetic peptidoglycan transglycosylase
LKPRSVLARHALRLALLVLLCAAALQIVFALRIGAMRLIDPQSTAFQRSEAWRLLTQQRPLAWQQRWVDTAQIAVPLQRAVIASEDAGFVEHAGVDWGSIEKAWQKNQRLEARHPAPGGRPAAARIVGGSTITQQLAKNLFLSGERTVLRKAQELVLTLLLEATLSKRRILEIYLNEVEWGQGLFGAQAAARHYYQVDASRLGPEQAARLAVMLPAPKRFEQNPGSAYIVGRSATVLARMAAVGLP